MSTEKPTAAESAQWHRDRASVARHDSNVAFGEGQKRATADLDAIEAHHEAAAEALELLAEIAKARMDRTTAWAVTHNGAPPNGVALNLPSELAARIVALVEGK